MCFNGNNSSLYFFHTSTGICFNRNNELCMGVLWISYLYHWLKPWSRLNSKHCLKKTQNTVSSNIHTRCQTPRRIHGTGLATWVCTTWQRPVSGSQQKMIFCVHVVSGELTSNSEAFFRAKGNARKRNRKTRSTDAHLSIFIRVVTHNFVNQTLQFYCIARQEQTTFSD